MQDDVMEHIRRQPHLVSLAVEDLRVANIQTDLSIPAGAEHEPVEPLDTRITKLDVSIGFGPQPLQLAAAMVTYLLLRIPTLRQLKTFKVPQESIRDFVNEYVQWYPHLAHVELDMMG
ncbi:hypothetical protein H4R19_004834 [Coemansia spiralis]|nr:hypothetical protein H4R19_004834 [Coemansia spiralis]